MLAHTLPCCSLLKLALRKRFRTHSTSLSYVLVAVEYVVQHPEACVNILDMVFSQNVTPTQAKTVFHVHKALIAAKRGAEQQANTHKPQSRCAHFLSVQHNTGFCVNCFYSNSSRSDDKCGNSKILHSKRCLKNRAFKCNVMCLSHMRLKSAILAVSYSCFLIMLEFKRRASQTPLFYFPPFYCL